MAAASRTGATSAPACSPTDRGPPEVGSARPSGSPGGCTAAPRLGWTLGFALLGAVLGNLSTRVDGLLDSPQARELVQRLGGTSVLTDAFLSSEMGFLGLIAAGFALSGLSRIHAEEASGRLESLLAAGTGRARWLGAHLAVLGAATALVVAAGGLTAGLAHAAAGGTTGDVGRDLAAALVRLPAVGVVLGAGVLLLGVRSRWTAYSWGLLVACLVLGELGALMGLPGWLQDLSPFVHVPALPGATLDLAPVLVLSGVAGVLVAGGVVCFTRRDVTPD